MPPDLVQRLVEAERQPIRQLEERKANEEAKLKLANDLKTRISNIQAEIAQLSKFKKFRDLMPQIGRPELMDVTVDKELAEAGSYQIEVVQLAGRSSMMSNAFTDPDETAVGVGYFSYELPNGDVKEVYISEEDSTLNGIARLINRQKDLGLNAIVVNDGTGEDDSWRLIVTHNKTGEVNDAEFPEFYFLDGDDDFFLDKERMAQNAVLKVNGFEVEFEGNKIDSLLPGVTIDLKDAAPGKEFTLGIVEDTKSIKGKVEAFVKKINEVLQFIQDQNKLDEKSNTRNTLGGDVTLQSVEHKLRSLIMGTVPTAYGSMRLGDMGITFNKNGLLDVNDTRLEKVIKDDFESVAQFFTGINDDGSGFATQIDRTVAAMTKNPGVVQSRVEGIKRRIDDIDRQIEAKERQVANTEKNLKEKFAKLEGTIAKLKQQQASAGATLGGGSILGNLQFNNG
ncbi:MAG: flagellar filament capping protein FliD [Bdellovibrionales bacterium]|nr:flagellar filament capping protein FliD [Bdellovibrionales bacterium]